MGVDEDETTIPIPTSASSSQIKAIAKETVHKICSGQVVLSLAVAVKELVENSLDAGATLVEVKLKSQGLEGVEVSDNGNGVEDDNLEGMTAKYHTSKIREFNDLMGVETFGFRGEALSSLCALSDMTIQTRHVSTAVGLKVELEHDGSIKSRTRCARGVGTTVILSNLFSTLPVRRRDFARNIKKEFTKMCQILQAYCLVSKGVRILCSNQSMKGIKTVVLQTHGAPDVLANISAVFGTRQVADIVPLKSPFEQGPLKEVDFHANDVADLTCTQISAEDVESLNRADFEFEGYISSCRHGAGRSSKDRQFFFVNSRPCDPKNISKIINEIYHRYNGQQQPFVYLNVVTSRADVDVNLTPDKRQLLLNNEKILLLALRKALLNTFGSTPSTFVLQNSSIASMLEVKPKIDKEQNQAKKLEVESTSDCDVPTTSTQRFADVLSQWKRTGDTKGVATTVIAKRRCSDELTQRTLKLQKIQQFLSREQTKEHSYKSDSESGDGDGDESVDNNVSNLNESAVNLHQIQEQSLAFDSLTQPEEAKQIDMQCKVKNKQIQYNVDRSPFGKLLKPQNEREINNAGKTEINQFHNSFDDSLINSSSSSVAALKTSEFSDTETEVNTRIEFDDSASDSEQQGYACNDLRTSLAEITDRLKHEENLCEERSKRNKLERLRFKTEINPNQNQKAEAELQKEISKTDFVRMDIIGQFNLGFIIVKLDDDLFIVDQHATDEKYNFEVLQRTTELQYQRMAVPQALELTTMNEMILLDHLLVFEKNGFKFEVNHEAPTTKKVRLLGKPYSKNWEFGREDIDELIFMLQDAPEGTVCRPSRIRAMFASRACRKSVMIGKALNKSTMKRLINHMGEIEQPWVTIRSTVFR